MSMEHRAWITITGFPAASEEDRWAPFMSVLERDASEYGPILSWSDEHTAQIVMSTGSNCELGLAARVFVVPIIDALSATGLAPDAQAVAIEFELPDRSVIPA